MNCIRPTDTKVTFSPPRPDYFPDIYVAANHPKHSGAGTAYFYILDGSPSGLKKIKDLEEDVICVPNGPEEEAVAQGFLKLVDGDAIFARLASSPSSGEKDVAVMWVNGRDIFSAKLQGDTIAARDIALGPRDQRTCSEPTNAGGGERVGGTAWERTHPTKVRGGRCYTFDLSYQAQKAVCSPCADGKVKSNDDACISMRSNLIKVASDMAMQSFRTGPSEIREHIDLNAQIFNIPAVGVDGNTAFAAAQLNLAPTRKIDSNETLGDSMGTAGDDHIDDDDDAGHYSNMTAVSDLPASFDPGRFFILYPGVFITLTSFASACFSGLRRHGSSPPIAPANATAEELAWAMRFALIAYPPKGMTGSNQRRPLGALAMGNILYTIPEMITPEPSPIPLSCKSSTFAEDGRVIIPRLSLVTFLARSFLSIVLCILAQLDPGIGAQVDSDAFLRSFSFTNNNGVRQRVGPWALGPGWRSPHPLDETDVIEDELVSQRTLIESKYRQWKDYYNFYAGHIPFAVCSGAVEALEKDKEGAGINDPNPPTNQSGAGPSPAVNPNGQNAPKKKPSAKKTSKGKNKAGTQAGPTKGPKKSKKTVLSDAGDTNEDMDSSDVLHLAWSGDGYNKLVSSFTPTNATSSSSRSTRSHRTIELADGTRQYPMVIDDSDHEMEEEVADNTSANIELPTYLKSVTSFVINSESIETQSAVMDLLSNSLDVPLGESMKTLQAHHDAITSRPMDASSVPLLRSSWVGVNALLASERANALLLRKQCSCIMFTAYTSWLWLHAFIPGRVRFMLHNANADHAPWLASLVDYADGMVMSGGMETTFVAQSCGLDMPGTACTISSILPDGPNAYDDGIVAIVVEVLEKWLAYPSNEQVKYQAYFVHVLLRDIGHNILMLDAVWKMYQRVNRRSFLGCGPLKFDNTLPAVQHTHPLFNLNSSERRNIDDIANVVNEFINGKLVNRPKTANNALPVDIIPHQLTGAMDHRLSLFKQFVADCYLVIFKQVHISNDKLYCALRTRPDYFVPFREHAPTRIHMRDCNGPFAPSRARSIEGVFSALVGRSITFGTEFSRTGRTYFTSPDDFQAACHAMGPQDDKFFCNPAAYGQHNHKKNLGLADAYWEKLQEYQWPGLSTGELVPFMECFRFFKPSSGPARFAELGNLAAFLLTADYVYAKVVSPPSKEEMGNVVQVINLGAVGALELLGFIPTRQKTAGGSKAKAVIKSCVDGFNWSYDVVASCIDEAEHDLVGIDYIMTENTLCKFCRALSNNLISL